MSNTLSAQTEFVAGYTPRNDGVYEHAVVLTAGGTWNIPSGVTNIRAVLIGGGQGGRKGANGEAGENGESCTVSPNSGYYTGTGEGGAGGAGGAGGPGGAGGKIKIITVDVPAGVTSITLSIGSGGAGSTVEGQDGASGGATTLKLGGTTYTSADGEAAQGGFVNLMTGQLFGIKGSTGVSGAAGGAGVLGKTVDEDNNYATGETTAVGEAGGSSPPNNGGAGGTGAYATGGRVIVRYTSVEGTGHAGKAPSQYKPGTVLSKYTTYSFDNTTGTYTLRNLRTFTVPTNASGNFSWYETRTSSTGRMTLIHAKLSSVYISTAGKYNQEIYYDDREYDATPVYDIAWGKGRGGGGGGGAAVSNDGGAASVNNGGVGAAGTRPGVPTTRGAGGTGGSGGGGGGGGGGSLLITQSTITTSYTCDGGTGGAGGSGGPGGNGAPGCVIIYY